MWLDAILLIMTIVFYIFGYLKKINKKSCGWIEVHLFYKNQEKNISGIVLVIVFLRKLSIYDTSIQPHDEISCDWLETPAFLTSHMEFHYVIG